jgi:hypothetical protein
MWVSVDETTDASRRQAVKCCRGIEKRSNIIREIISSVMQGNFCSESHKSSTCFQRCYADCMTRCGEI